MSQCVTTRMSVCVSWFFRKSDWSTVSLGQHDSNLGLYCLSISPAIRSMKYNPLHCPMPQVLTCDNKWTFAKPNSHCLTDTKSILALAFSTGTHYIHSRTTGWAAICFITSATHPVSEGKISLNCVFANRKFLELLSRYWAFAVKLRKDLGQILLGLRSQWLELIMPVRKYCWSLTNIS